MKEGSEDTGISDERKERYMEWPPIIVRKAELSTKGVEVTLVLAIQLQQWGFEFCKQLCLR